MTMDGSQLIQSFESLWFFSNVVSSRTPNASSGIEEETTQPTSSILQTGLPKNNECEFLTPKCGGLAAEIEEHDGDEPVVMAEEVEIPKPAKKGREEKEKAEEEEKQEKDATVKRRHGHEGASQVLGFCCCLDSPVKELLPGQVGSLIELTCPSMHVSNFIGFSFLCIF
ncbi:hypothetical protein OIU79_020787 [Salix purpurea]|uniref:Uncharacterized protein n=1 Tax=Salix purpurea TaxID=77065 RepID=A0A9Q0WMY1_SALPP|nr:hypothetical protein OIU79_020787 [Salix purpurea]